MLEELRLSLGADAAPEADADEGQPLLRAIECDGIVESLALFADAASIAQLCGCSISMQEKFGAASLWSQLLQARWGSPLSGTCPRREYARRELMERWDLTPPRVAAPDTSSRRRADVPTTPRTEPAEASRRSAPCQPSPGLFSPTLLQDKENTSPNTLFLRAPTLRRRGRATSSPESANGTHATAGATRLKQDLFELMTGGEKCIGAFPDAPGDFSSWSGHVVSATDGSLHGGLRFNIRLQYDMHASGDDALPVVTFARPHCFHPNVSADGVLCPRALRKRCAPVDSVRTLLLRIRELVACPCFAVPPVNKAAAVLWYGDQATLEQHRRRQDWLHPSQVPLTAPKLRLAFSENEIHG